MKIPKIFENLKIYKSCSRFSLVADPLHASGTTLKGSQLHIRELAVLCVPRVLAFKIKRSPAQSQCFSFGKQMIQSDNSQLKCKAAHDEKVLPQLATQLPIVFHKSDARTSQFSKLTRLIGFTVNQIEGLNNGSVEN